MRGTLAEAKKLGAVAKQGNLLSTIDIFIWLTVFDREE